MAALRAVTLQAGNSIRPTSPDQAGTRDFDILYFPDTNIRRGGQGTIGGQFSSTDQASSTAASAAKCALNCCCRAADKPASALKWNAAPPAKLCRLPPSHEPDCHPTPGSPNRSAGFRGRVSAAGPTIRPARDEWPRRWTDAPHAAADELGPTMPPASTF